MKMIRINKVVCNSFFTKKIIDKEYGVNSLVIYPPVNTKSLKPKRKDNLILYVGRFSQILQSKNQDILIKIFKKMYDSTFKDWKLVLAGGVEVGVGNYIDKLKKLVANYPVEIFESPSHQDLLDLYGKAKIFWSAAGYGVNENKYPEKVEHFGITVVEAMAAGAVPVVYNAGGYKEIVEDGKNGYLWDNTNTLMRKTKEIIKTRMKFSTNAIETSKKYSLEEFEKNITGVLLKSLH
jgi:glycosyltransferase involved in cell wall biosynthesis